MTRTNDKFICCEELRFFLEEGKLPLCYNKSLRYLGIVLKSGAGLQTLSFCPWCGKQFQEELSDQLELILNDELKLDTNLVDYLDDARVPQEFKSDEWWIKRGL